MFSYHSFQPLSNPWHFFVVTSIFGVVPQFHEVVKQHRQDRIFSGRRVKPKTVITTIVSDFCNPQNMDRIITYDNAKD